MLLPCGAQPPSRDGMRERVVTCLKCPPHSATSGRGGAEVVLSTQPLSPASSRLDLAERSSDERGGHLLPALRLAQPGVPVLGDRGGEGWLRACRGYGHGAGQGLGCGCPSSADRLGLQPYPGRMVTAHPLRVPSPAVVTSGLLLSGLPCHRGSAPSPPPPLALPQGSHGELATVTVPRARAWGFHLLQ